MRLILLGAPGSGKGTQATQIVSWLGIAHLSTGEILRTAAASTSALGRELHDIMERGELVSDDIVVEIVAERLQHNDVQDGYILDGFPRTVAQAVALDKVIGARNEKLDLVIELKVVPQDLIRRIATRAKEAVARGEKRRADDNPETFKLRLQAYHAQTAPLVDYYRSKNLLRSVNGMMPMDEVAAAIRSVIGA
jgi:adenylate kinase